jgi:hypothetical protein
MYCEREIRDNPSTLLAFLCAEEFLYWLHPVYWQSNGELWREGRVFYNRW